MLSPRGRKELDMTEQLNHKNNIHQNFKTDKTPENKTHLSHLKWQ